MKKTLFLFVVLFLPWNAFADYYLGEISDSHYIIYRDDDVKLAEIKQSHRSWHLNCVNGVSFGSNNQKFDSRDMAINIAEQQCKIWHKTINMIELSH